jgi:hypothetical protein
MFRGKGFSKADAYSIRWLMAKGKSVVMYCGMPKSGLIEIDGSDCEGYFW